jgi:hypothetical protein
MNVIATKNRAMAAALVATVSGMMSWACTSTEGADAPWQPPKNALRVQVRITTGEGAAAGLPAVHHVGDTLTVDAFITNATKRPVLIPKATTKDVIWSTFVTGFPGAQQPTVLYGPARKLKGKPMVRARKENFDEIQPGQGRKSTPWNYKLVLPGKAEVVAVCENPHSKYLAGYTTAGDYTYEAVSGAWHGRAIGTAKVLVSAEMSAEMKRRFDDTRKIVNSADEPLKKKLATLESVAREKHYFAARFVWDVWKTTPDDAIKAAALRHLCDLLKFGTAYEALHDVVRSLRDGQLDAQAKKRVLDILGGVVWRGYPGLPIAGGRGFYVLPDALLRDVRAALRKISVGKSPELAAKARSILKHASKSGTKTAPSSARPE